MGRMTLILGGARSGKSTYAEHLAAKHGGQVTFIATAQALDDEMRTRITAHRQKRPDNWRTLEIPIGVGAYLQAHPSSAIAPQQEIFLLDCLTLLVSNLLLQAAPNENAPDEGAAAALVASEIDQLLQAIHSSPAEWVVVSNEVGLGLVPPYPLGRLYRDLLGWANQRMAARADQVIFMLAGIPMRLTPVAG
jgi:adenosylcobinamide kinase / adenosylcobinamide-phosphate guanylyltransferase